MARTIKDRTNVDPVDGTNPYGATKNESAPTANDGTPYDEELHGDELVLAQRIMDLTRATPNELPDNTINGFQLYDALTFLIGTNISWETAALTLPQASTNKPQVAALTPTRIAWIDATAGFMRTYDFDGAIWVQVGNTLSITGTGGQSAICALSATRIAFIDNTLNQIRAYDFDGTDWAQQGNSLTVTFGGNSSICAMTSGRVAHVESTSGDLTTYDFDGTDWTKIGNTLALPGSQAAVTGLSSTRIALIRATENEVRAYNFDGTDWTLTGSALSFTNTGPFACTLSVAKEKILVSEGLTLTIFDFDGSNWTLIEELTATFTETFFSVTSFSESRIAAITFIDGSNSRISLKARIPIVPTILPSPPFS